MFKACGSVLVGEKNNSYNNPLSLIVHCEFLVVVMWCVHR